MTPPTPSRPGVQPSPSDEASPGGHGHSPVGALVTGVDHFNVMSLELLSGILVWGGAGWLLDRWLGTAHWFFGFGVMLGYSAGLYLVYLRTRTTRATTGTEDCTTPATRGRTWTREGR